MKQAKFNPKKKETDMYICMDTTLLFLNLDLAINWLVKNRLPCLLYLILSQVPLAPPAVIT